MVRAAPRILETVDAVDEDDTGIEGLFAQEDAEQGGLARTVGAD